MDSTTTGLKIIGTAMDTTIMDIIHSTMGIIHFTMDIMAIISTHIFMVMVITNIIPTTEAF